MMYRGLYRFNDEWVQVKTETGTLPVHRQIYEARGYEPSFITLPTIEDYLDRESRDGQTSIKSGQDMEREN